MSEKHSQVRYLIAADVIALHAEMMRDMGHAPAPLRDAGLLESAVLRPQTAAYYEHAGIVRQAALLGAGIAQNQPFIDGNKRAAYLAMLIFLRVNGRPFHGDRMELARRIEGLGAREGSLEDATRHLEAWLEQYVTPAG
jgi:death on curing protein